MNVHRLVPSGLSLVSTALLLSACGGGGGGGGAVTEPLPARQPLAITSSNYQTVAAQSVGTGSYMKDAGTSTVLGVEAQALPQPLWLAQREALRLAARFSQAQGTVVVQGATRTVVQPCSLGGSIEVTLVDANGNQNLDAGDSMSLKASACRDTDGTLDGTMDYSLKTVSGTFGADQYSATVSAKLTNLRVTSSAGSISGQGEFQMTITATAANTTSVALTIPSLVTSGTGASGSFQTTLTSFSLSVNTVPSGAGYRSTLSFGGTVNSTVLESRDITLSTPVALVQESIGSYPTSGQILAKGANGSQVRVTAQPEGKALVELDANGDNAFETSTTKNWTDLKG